MYAIALGAALLGAAPAQDPGSGKDYRERKFDRATQVILTFDVKYRQSVLTALKWVRYTHRETSPKDGLMVVWPSKGTFKEKDLAKLESVPTVRLQTPDDYGRAQSSKGPPVPPKK